MRIEIPKKVIFIPIFLVLTWGVLHVFEASSKHTVSKFNGFLSTPGVQHIFSDKDCSTLKWTPNKYMPEVCGYTTSDKECAKYTFDESRVECQLIGARLCTREELQKGVPNQNSCPVGDHVWSAETCGPNLAVAVEARRSDKVDEVCDEAEKEHVLACCADVKIPERVMNKETFEQEGWAPVTEESPVEVVVVKVVEEPKVAVEEPKVAVEETKVVVEEPQKPKSHDKIEELTLSLPDPAGFLPWLPGGVMAQKKAGEPKTILKPEMDSTWYYEYYADNFNECTPWEIGFRASKKGTIAPKNAYIKMEMWEPNRVFYDMAGVNAEILLFHEYKKKICDGDDRVYFVKDDSYWQDYCLRSDGEPPEKMTRHYRLTATPGNEWELTLVFVPDPSFKNYKMTIVGLNMDPANATTFTLTSRKPSYEMCTPSLNLPFPSANQFKIYAINDDSSQRPMHSFEIDAGVPKIFVIRPYLVPIEYVNDEINQLLHEAGAHANFALLANQVGGIRSKYAFKVQQAFDNEARGYKFILDPRDVGTYKFKVSLLWFYGDNPEIDINVQPSHVVGSHTQHIFNYYDWRQSIIDQTMMIEVYESKTKEVQLFGNKMCGTDRLTQPGRWFNLPLRQDCNSTGYENICTGSRANTKLVIDVKGDNRPHIWTPFECYYHLWSAHDLVKCAKTTDQDWIAIIGDSVVREVVGSLNDLFNPMEKLEWFLKGRFEELDKYYGFDANGEAIHIDMLNDDDKPESRDDDRLKDLLRLTFQFQEFMYGLEPRSMRVFRDRDLGYFEAINLLGERKDAPRPSVLIYTPAMAYCAWKMTLSDFKLFIDEIAAYCSKANELPLHRGKAVKMIYYGHPQLWSQAHSGSSPYVTNQRARRMDEYARITLGKAGFEYLDTLALSASRPSCSWDGLHYLRCGGTQCNGHVSHMIFNIAMNYIYNDCKEIDRMQ